MRFRSPPRALLLSWLALLTLLAVTVFAAYQPLGPLNTGLALAIASAKALLVAVVFMELRRANTLTVAVAAAGVFWLAIMLWLALGDYVTRPGFRADPVRGPREPPAQTPKV
jgi:cytochrome c oxidase subunit 4